MVTDLLCPVSWRSAPGSFVSLMTLYESNYIRLGWILQDLNGLQGRHVSRGADGVGLHLEVIERSRYTTLLNLSYRFAGDLGEVVTPDMQVRVYHDARLVEACACADQPGHDALRRLRDSLSGELNRRWARNMLLNKWLEYCAERGHHFSAATRQTIAVR